MIAFDLKLLRKQLNEIHPPENRDSITAEASMNCGDVKALRKIAMAKTASELDDLKFMRKQVSDMRESFMAERHQSATALTQNAEDIATLRQVVQKASQSDALHEEFRKSVLAECRESVLAECREAAVAEGQNAVPQNSTALRQVALSTPSDALHGSAQAESRELVESPSQNCVNSSALRQITMSTSTSDAFRQIAQSVPPSGVFSHPPAAAPDNNSEADFVLLS